MTSLEMYFYNKSGGAVKNTVATTTSDGAWTLMVTPSSGKRLVLMGLEIIPSAASVVVNIAFGAGTTSLFTNIFCGGVVVPIPIDMRECPPPPGAIDQSIYAKITTANTVTISFYTMEID